MALFLFDRSKVNGKSKILKVIAHVHHKQCEVTIENLILRMNWQSSKIHN